MNIAILTQPICNNYGGILQNYALQTVLERQGHTVTTLNFPVISGYSGSKVRHILSTCRRVLRKLNGDPAVVWVDLATEYRKQVELAHLQKIFLDNHQHLYTICPPITREQVEQFHFDAFVVGSDQVWRPRYNAYIPNLFLDFTEGMSVKRIAYAASFGTDQWEFSAEQTTISSFLAKKFDVVSVREASGIQLCKQNLGVDAIQVLDPTLLLSAEEYLFLCTGNEHPQGDYIAVYTLDYTKKKMTLLKEVSRYLNTPLHFIGRFTKKGYPSVESWLEGIANAKYVITDSFHGTVFSTIFMRQIITLGNAVRGNSRFDSLFNILGIPKERQTNNVNQIIDLLQQPIDYKSVNRLKAEWQDKSNSFLQRI